jgi:signal transduction histidine kinase
LLYLKGWGFSKIGNIDSTLHFYREAIQLYIDQQNFLQVGRIYYKIGLFQLINGMYDESLKNTQKSIENFKKVSAFEDIAHSYIQIAYLYHDIQNYSKGIEYGNQALEVISSLDLPTSDLESQALNSIAICYDDSGNFGKSIEYQKLIFSLKSRLSDTNRVAMNYNNMGNSLLKMGILEEAENYFQKNLNINQKTGNKYGLATVLTNLGTVEYLKGNYDKSKHFLDQAHRYAHEIQDVEKIQDVIYQYFEYYKHMGNLSQAISYLNDYYEFKDSLLSVERVQSLHQLETEFRTKEKELIIQQQQVQIKNKDKIIEQNLIIGIGLLTILILLIVVVLLYRNKNEKKIQLIEKNSEIENKELQLQAIIATQEQERQRFSTDLHDSFGQTISVLKMNVGTIKTLDLPNHTNVLNESEIMLSKIYDELQSICFNLMPKTLVENGLINALLEFARRINISKIIHVEVYSYNLDTRLSSSQEIAVYRIVQEWVNNTLKYSSSKNIVIQITSDGDEVTLTVENDGLGFDPKKLELSSGNGWKNIHTRLGLLQGQLNLDTHPDYEGTTLTIDFRKN